MVNDMSKDMTKVLPQSFRCESNRR